MTSTYVSQGTPGKVYVQNLYFDDNTIHASSNIGNGNINLTSAVNSHVDINTLEISNDNVNNAIVMETDTDDKHIVIRTSGNGSIILGNTSSTSSSNLSLIANMLTTSVTSGTIKIDTNGTQGTVNVSDTIYVKNGRLGVMNLNPNYAVDVIGNINFTGELYKNGTLYSLQFWNENVGLNNGIYYNGNVKIGATGIPLGNLDISVSAGKGLQVYGDTGASFPQAKFTDSSNGIYVSTDNSEIGKYGFKFVNSNNLNVFYAGNDGKIGIGTNTPSSTLDINGDLNVSSNINVVGNFNLGGNLVLSGIIATTANFTTITGLGTATVDTMVVNNLAQVGSLTSLGDAQINGDTSITGYLEITNNSQTVSLIGTDSSFIGYYPSGSSNRKAYTGFTNDTSNFIIDTEDITRNICIMGGNVGIHTKSPVHLLTINTNGGTEHNNNETYSHGIGITTGTDNQTMMIGYDGRVGYDIGYINVSKTGVVRPLILQSNNGYVGIGIVNPSYELDINGNLNFTGSLYQNGAIYQQPGWSLQLNNDIIFNLGGKVGIDTINPIATLDIGGNTDGSVQAIFTRGYDNNFQLQAINESSSNASGAIVSKFGLRHGTNETALFNFVRGNLENDGSLAIVTNNVERMRVNSVGNVGFGTSDPGSLVTLQGNNSILQLQNANVGGNTFISYYNDSPSNARSGWTGYGNNTDYTIENEKSGGNINLVTNNGTLDIQSDIHIHNGELIIESVANKKYTIYSENDNGDSAFVISNDGTKSTINFNLSNIPLDYAVLTSPNTNNYNTLFDLYSYNTNSGITSSTRISSGDSYFGGRISIGKTSASYDVDIVGDINFTGSIYQNGVLFTGSYWENNSNKIYYNSGNVGIGTNDPVTLFDIATTGTTPLLQLRNGNLSNTTTKSQMIFSYNGLSYNNGGYAHSIKTRHDTNSSENNAIEFYVWDRLNDSVNSIGTKLALDVNASGVNMYGNLFVGGSSSSNYIEFSGTTSDGAGNGGYTYIGERIYGGSEQSELFIYKGGETASNNGPDRIRYSAVGEHIFQTSSSDIADNSFENAATNVNWNTRMIIKNNGNIGVGLNNPSYKLDVNGDIHASGDIRASGLLYSNGSIINTTQWTDVTNGIYYNSNVSIGGVNNPSSALDVTGDINYTGTLYNNGIPLNVSGLWTNSTLNGIYVLDSVAINQTSAAYSLDVNGDINFTGTLYQNGSVMISSFWDKDVDNNLSYSDGKVITGNIELEENIISSSEKGDSLIGKTLTITNPVKNGYVDADGSSLNVYDYYHASKVMDSYDLVPILSSNTSSSAGSVVGNGTYGLIAEYYRGYAWDTLMATVHDTQINYGNNAQFMSKVREYSGSFNRMFSVKWSGNLTLPTGSYDLIIDDAILAPGQHTITDLFEAGSYNEVNQPVVDNENSWDSASWRALMNGMRLPYLSEILERRELGVDLKAIVVCFNDSGISDLDAWTLTSNSSQWQYSGHHYVSITTGGDGMNYYPFGEVFLSGSSYSGDYDEFALYMRSDCRMFDTRYIDNDYNQPNMDDNTNKASWESKNRFAQAIGGRLPTIEEVRARKFLQCYAVSTSDSNIWIPCTNSAYDGESSYPSQDMVEIGTTSASGYEFGKSKRSAYGWAGTWSVQDTFSTYNAYTVVIFDNMDQSLSYNGSNITGTNIVSKTVSGPYTKKYSVSVPDTNAYSIEFSKNGQGYRQLLLAPQSGDRKRWLTPLDFSVSHSSVIERYKAFDGSLVDEFTSLNYIREPIGWVGTSKTVLDSVVLGAKSGSEMFMPRLFDIEGTIDGVHWKRLKSFGAVRSYGQKEFVVGSGLGCIGYRIVVLGTFMNGVDNVVKIALLQFKTRGYESFVVPSESGKMINLTNTDEDMYITSNSGVVNIADVAFKENSLFVRKLQSETDIGHLIDWNGTSAIPEGYVIADGAEYDGDEYPEAYKKSLEDTVVVRDIVPALKSNSSSSEGSVVTGSETVPNGLIAHCFTSNSTGTSYVYVKSELVSGVDIDNAEYNALFGVSDQNNAAIDFEGYLYVASSGNYSFYVKVDDHVSLMIDDEPLGFHGSATGTSWVDMSTDSGSTSNSNPTFLSQGYHKIRCRHWGGGGAEFIHLAMAAGGTGVGNISDSNIIPSSSFVPYLKEDYYKAFDKKDLITISPHLLDSTWATRYVPGMEKNSMAIRSSIVAFYEYIGWYSSEAYIITHFVLAPNTQYYNSYATDFELQGSNDNSNWTTIQVYANATELGINYVSPYGNGYRGYRVKVLSNNSNASSSVAQKMIVCNELGFYGVRFEDAHKHLPRNLIPVMTSNTTPRGVAIAGTVYSSDEPWKAFDNDNTSYYHTTLFVGAALNEEQYLGWYDTSLVRKKIITGFSLYARNVFLVYRSPVYFKLQGTLDGFTWYDIETFSKTYMEPDNYAQHFIVSKQNYIECNGFRILMIAPNVGTDADYIDINFIQVWAFDHGVFNVPNVSGKLFKLYEGTSVLKLGKNIDAPYVEYDTTSLGTQKTLANPVPAGFVSIDGTGSTTLDVEDYPELIDKHIYIGKEYSLVPALTSNTSEGVVVYTNYLVTGNYTSAHLVFDGIQIFGSNINSINDKGYYSAVNPSSSQTSIIGWYNLSLQTKKILKAFLVYGRTQDNVGWTSRTPKNFTVQGTLDGINWTTIQTYSILQSYHARYFRVDLSNTTTSNAYYGFRLEVSEAWSGELILSQLNFIVEDYNEDVLVQLFPSSLVPLMDYGTGAIDHIVTNSNIEEVFNQPDPMLPFEMPYIEYLYKAFDPDLVNEFQSSLDPDTYLTTDISNHTPFYIGWYDTSLSSKKIITGLFLHSKAAIEPYVWSELPYNFKLEGTNDGTNWEFIESFSHPFISRYYNKVVTNRSNSYYGFRLWCVVPSSLIVSNNIALIFGYIDFQCVDESDLKTLTVANSAGKMLKVSNAIEVTERLNDNLVEVGSLALDTLRGNNELAVGATRKWNGIGYVPRGFAVMRGQRLGTLDYPKVFEALVDLQTPFLINPAMTSDTAPYGVVVYNSILSSLVDYAAYNAFNRVALQDDRAYVSGTNPSYPIHLGWYHTGFEKKKVLVEFHVWCRYEVNSNGSIDFVNWLMPTVFSVQGTLDGTTWATIQTYDMTFTIPNGYRKGVFTVEKENRNNAYVGFRLLMFNNNFTNGTRIDIEELSFYVIDEPSKPVVLQPKPLVPNYTDWDNPSGNLVYSSYYADHYPWNAFNNDFSVPGTGNKQNWHASGSTKIDTRVSTAPYMGEYIGWYNTQLLNKKVLIYTRWTIGYDHVNRYSQDSVRKGFVQGTLDGINWENIQSFDTNGQYVEYYLNNDNRNKAYYGFRLYIIDGMADGYVVMDSLQFMCLDEDEYFSFELPDSPDTLVNLERVQGIAVEGSIGTNSRGDGLSIKVNNNSETNSALVVSNSIGNEIEEASTTLLNVRNNGGVDIGGYLRIGMSSIDAGGLGGALGSKALYIATTYSNTDPYKYGWWIGGQDNTVAPSDNDLHFTVVKDGVTTAAGYVQDTTSNGLMNFTGQHRTFVNDISLSSIDEYVGLIVCASQDSYVKMSGGIAYGQDAITVNESLPVVALSKNFKDKRCFGVISSMEDPEQRKEANGNFVSLFTKEKGDTRVFINSVGEGAMWVVSGRHGVGGALESGDYITTSNITGYGCLQDDDLLHNYTVAKITMNCDFAPPKVPKMVIKKDDKGENVLDDDGLLQWTQMLDSEGAVVYEDKYLIRHILADGTVLTEEEYIECIENDADAYVAAFVGCTYHCG